MSNHIQQLAFRQMIIAPRDLVANEIVEVTPGGPVGWTDSSAAEGEIVTVHLQGRVDGTNPSPAGESATYAGEAWPTVGASIYYNRVTGKIGLDATDQKLGHVMEVKPANDVQGCVFFNCCGRDATTLLMTLDFSKAETLPFGVIGDVVLDLGPVTLVSGSLRASGLTSNSGGDLATISLGDSAGTGAEVLAGTVITTLNGSSPNALNSNIAIAGNLIMRIAVENIDGGKLIIEGTLAAF
jgi:hypothetical protein